MIREAPALGDVTDLDDNAHVSDRPTDEPKLCVDNLQGNGLAGFNKDHQTLLFLETGNVAAFKAWLAAQIPFVATLAEVAAFNRLFKAARFRRNSERGAVQATWMNIAFTKPGIQKILGGEPGFTDASFNTGLAAQSPLLGDPQDAGAEGNPANWIVGGPAAPDVVVIVAGDDAADTAAEVRRIEDSLFASHPGTAGQATPATIIFKQHGATLPPPLTGHEHFGWLDGVSQPGVRGTLTDMVFTDPGGARHLDLLTLHQNANDHGQGKPGQDVLYPGEFVFGYPRQAGAGRPVDAPGPVAQAGPAWSDDGSFVVIRRLRQDVPGFHAWLAHAAMELNMTPEHLGALLVGRWQSGSPLMFDAVADQPKIGKDDNQNNWFEFGSQPNHGGVGDDSQSPIDAIVPPTADPGGLRCPFSAHIRKAYPRDDVSATGQPLPIEADTQTHRLLRRGIPFGEPYEPTGAPDDGDRGLLFVAYMTSIVNQFEFVLRNWVNNAAFKDANVGQDPIIGTPGGTLELTLTVTFPDGNEDIRRLRVPASFVTPTGGGYFFAPGLKALYAFCGVPVPHELCRFQHPPQGNPPPAPTPPVYRA